MTDLKELVHLNVELEGLLKVLIERDSAEAKTLLADKFDRYSRLISDYLAEPTVHGLQEVKDAAGELAADASYVELKDQEAQESEIEDEDTAAGAALESVGHSAPHRSLASAFTLNDKYRYIREIFNGNEADFDDTIAVLDNMESFREAEDYIVNDLMMDASNHDVAEFLDTLAANF